MSWTLEENGKIPVYLQIAQKLMAEIENGTLKEGERLMPERKLSENLHVARNTVKQAYEELCREGYASTKKAAVLMWTPAEELIWTKSMRGDR